MNWVKSRSGYRVHMTRKWKSKIWTSLKSSETVKSNQAEKWVFHIQAVLKISKGQITKKPISIKDEFLAFNYIAYQLNYHVSTYSIPLMIAQEFNSYFRCL